MARERWGTFAVKDHLTPNAFVTEVLLFDRLVIPTPPPRHYEALERWLEEGGCFPPVDDQEWHDKGRKPEVLYPLLEILNKEKLVVPVPWTSDRINHARNLTLALRRLPSQPSAEEIAQWSSRRSLLEDLPTYVEGAEAAVVFRSLEDFDAAVKPKGDAPSERIPAEVFYAVLGHEFLSPPDDPKRSHHDLLTEAVEIASDKDFKRKRASFYRWQREFLKDSFTDDLKDDFTDRESLKRAIEEMNDLVKDYRGAAHNAAWRKGLTFVFTVAPFALSAALVPPATLAAAGAAVGGAFFTVAHFALGAMLPEETREPSPAAIVHDVRKGFGWA